MEVSQLKTGNEISNCQKQVLGIYSEITQLIAQLDKEQKHTLPVNPDTIDLPKAAETASDLIRAKFSEFDQSLLTTLHSNCVYMAAIHRMIASGSYEKAGHSDKKVVLDRLAHCSYELELASFNTMMNDSRLIIHRIRTEVSKREQLPETPAPSDRGEIFQDQIADVYQDIKNGKQESGATNAVSKTVDTLVAGALVGSALLKLGVGAILRATRRLVSKVAGIIPEVVDTFRDKSLRVAWDVAVGGYVNFLSFTFDSFLIDYVLTPVVNANLIAKYILRRSVSKSDISSQFDPSRLGNELNLGVEGGTLSKRKARELESLCKFEISSQWLQGSLWAVKPFLFIDNAPIALDRFLSSNNRDDLRGVFFRDESTHCAAARAELKHYVRAEDVFGVAFAKVSPAKPSQEPQPNTVILPVPSNKEVLLPLPAGAKIASIDFFDRNYTPVAQSTGQYEITRCIFGGFTVTTPPKAERVIYLIDHNKDDITQYHSALSELRNMLPIVGKEPVSSVATRNLLDQYFHKDSPNLNLDELPLVFNQLELHYIESNALVNFYKRHSNQLAGVVTDLRIGVCDTFTFLLDHYVRQTANVIGLRQAGYTFYRKYGNWKLDFSAGHAVNGIISLDGEPSYKEIDLTKLAEEREIGFSKGLELLFNLYAQRSADLPTQIATAKGIVELSKKSRAEEDRHRDPISFDKRFEGQLDGFLPKLLRSTMQSVKEISGELSVRPYDDQLFEQLIETLDVFGVGVRNLGELENHLCTAGSASALCSNVRDFVPQLFIIEHTWQYLNDEQKLRLITHRPEKAIFNAHLRSQIGVEINLFYADAILKLNADDFLRALPNLFRNVVYVVYGNYNPELSETYVSSDYRRDVPIALLYRLKEILLTEPNKFISPDTASYFIDYYFAMEVPDSQKATQDSDLRQRRELANELVELLLKQPGFGEKLLDRVLDTTWSVHRRRFTQLLAYKNLVSPEQVLGKLNQIKFSVEKVSMRSITDLGLDFTKSEWFQDRLNAKLLGELCCALSFNDNIVSDKVLKLANRKLTDAARRVLARPEYWDREFLSDTVWEDSSTIHFKYICDYFGIKPSEVSSEVPQITDQPEGAAQGQAALIENSKRIFLEVKKSGQRIDLSNCPKVISFLLAYGLDEQHVDSEGLAIYARVFANSETVNQNDDELLSYFKLIDSSLLAEFSQTVKLRLVSLLLRELTDRELYEATLVSRVLLSGRSIEDQRWLQHPSFSKKAYDTALQIDLLYKHLYKREENESAWLAPSDKAVFYKALHDQSFKKLFSIWREEVDLGDFNYYVPERSYAFFRSFEPSPKMASLKSQISNIWQEIGTEFTRNPRMRERLQAEIGFQVVDGGIRLSDTSNHSYVLRRVGNDEPVDINRINWRRSLTKDDHFYYNQSQYVRAANHALLFIDCEELIALGKADEPNNHDNLRKVFATIHALLKNKVTVDCHFYFRSAEFRESFTNLGEAYRFFHTIDPTLLRYIQLGATLRDIESQFYPEGKRLVVPQHFSLDESDFHSSTAVFINQNLRIAESQGLPVSLMQRKGMQFFRI